jgi:aryl-alcohol dehydrogenase-like predicted oxidoreductase
MIDRRNFLGIAAGAGAGLALTPALLRALQQSGTTADLLNALQQGKLIQRAIPSTGEMLPVVSFGPRPLGGAGFSVQPGDVAANKEILKTFLDNGGKVVDVMHGGPVGEQAARTAADELGIQNRFFWTTPLTVQGPGRGGAPPTPDAAALKAQIESKLAAFKVPRIDLVMMAAAAAEPTYLAALREMKKEGRIRYIGVHHLAFPPNAPLPPNATSAFGNLESVMRNEQIDFVATDYSVGDRRVEETILPLAQERKIAFMAYFAFNRGRLFQRVSSTPVPEWAAEFDAKTWAQFFLKYVISHPAVIVAREGTTKAEHMLDNLAGGVGRLPNEAMRKRMAQFVDALPTPPPVPRSVVVSATILDRYVGEYTTPTGNVVTIRRDGAALFVKPPGTNPELPLTARAEMRFADPNSRIYEFQFDAQGKVIGALVEQGPQPVKLVRK